MKKKGFAVLAVLMLSMLLSVTAFAIDYRYNQNKMQDETAEDTQDETQQQSEATNETQQQSDASGKQEAGK